MSSIHNYKYINKNNYELYNDIMKNCDIVISLLLKYIKMICYFSYSSQKKVHT